MKLEKFLRKLARETGTVSVKDGVITLSSGKSFDLGACLKEKTFAFVQEGGSSCELYLHAFESEEDSEHNRIECAKAAYRTSEIFKIPAMLNALGALFYETVDEIIDSLQTLDTVAVPEEDT